MHLFLQDKIICQYINLKSPWCFLKKRLSLTLFINDCRMNMLNNFTKWGLAMKRKGVIISELNNSILKIKALIYFLEKRENWNSIIQDKSLLNEHKKITFANILTDTNKILKQESFYKFAPPTFIASASAFLIAGIVAATQIPFTSYPVTLLACVVFCGFFSLLAVAYLTTKKERTAPNINSNIKATQKNMTSFFEEHKELNKEEYMDKSVLETINKFADEASV